MSEPKKGDYVRRNHPFLIALVIIILSSLYGTILVSGNATHPLQDIHHYLPGIYKPASTIHNAQIIGDPIYYPSMGDLWMSTWTDDNRLFLTWGDGVGFGDGYPTGFPAYLSPDPVTITVCDEGDMFCWLWCNMNICDAQHSYPRGPLTDSGILAFIGPVPGFVDVTIPFVDVPSGEPFFLETLDGQKDISGNNDKPSSILFYDGRLYWAGHYPAGAPTYGYLAYSDDYGQTWTEVQNSPWGSSSNFRVLMFINMGQAYTLNRDGYVYAFGVGTEASWTARTVYLARVPREAILDYNAYEYFIGRNGSIPQWSPNQEQAQPVEDLVSTGQASAMYHEGSGRYLFITTDGAFPDSGPGYGALFEAPDPWGPWSEVTRFCFDYTCNDGSLNPAWTDGKYIAGLIPKDAGPDFLYFTIAGGDNHYQLQIGMMALQVTP